MMFVFYIYPYTPIYSWYRAVSQYENNFRILLLINMFAGRAVGKAETRKETSKRLYMRGRDALFDFRPELFH